MSSNLAPYELFKYDYRLDRFLEKYKNGEAFDLVSGARVRLVYDPIIYTKLKRKDRVFAASVTFEDVQSKGSFSKRYRLSQFKKTEEFGDREDDGRGAYEDSQIHEINEQMGDIMDKSGEAFVRLTYKNKLVRVTHARRLPNGGKADIALVAPGGSDVFWISYKKGQSPRDMGPWASISEFTDYPEVTNFIEKIRDLCSLNDGVMWPGVTFARKIQDVEILNRAVFGREYNGAGIYSSGSVHVVCQGRIKLLKVGRSYKFVANKTIESGDRFRGDHTSYQPTLFAFHDGNNRLGSFNIKNSRFDIYPAHGRSITQWV